MFQFKYKDEKRLLERLWCILSNENNGRTAFWYKNGTTFVIANRSSFNSELCPMLFKGCTFEYFLYFLKVCGFSIHRIHRVCGLVFAHPQFEAWHPHFLRYNFIMIKKIRFTSELLQPEIFYKKSLSDKDVLESFTIQRKNEFNSTQTEQQNPSSETVLQYPAVSSEHVTEARNLPTKHSTGHHDSFNEHIVSLPIINQSSTQIPSQAVQLHQNPEVLGIQSMNNQKSKSHQNSTQIPSQAVQLHQNPEVLGIQSMNNQASWMPMDNQASWVIVPMENQTSSAVSLQPTQDYQDLKVSSQLNTLQTLPSSVLLNQGQSTNDDQNPCALSKCLPSYSNLQKRSRP